MNPVRLIQIAWCLNVFDMVSTLLIVVVFGGKEVNPVMAAVIEASPVLFVAVKFFGVGLGLMLLGVLESNAVLLGIVTFYSVLAFGNSLALILCLTGVR